MGVVFAAKKRSIVFGEGDVGIGAEQNWSRATGLEQGCDMIAGVALWQGRGAASGLGRAGINQ